MSIVLTEKASTELKTLIQKEIEAKNLTEKAVLRFGVVGGGCAGFSYRMGFDENVAEDDWVEDVKGVKVAIDSKSFLYLKGTEVDYHDGLVAKGFVFNNPNATHTCGCNHSFSA